MTKQNCPSLQVTAIRCENDGVALILDATDVFDGGENISRRIRFACEDPTEALEAIAAALWPKRKFLVTEEAPSEPH